MVISEDGRSIICGIYEKYHKRMLYTASQILGKTRGEEAVQNVFVRLLVKFDDNFEVLGDKPGQYFVIITRNLSLNMLKKEPLDSLPLEEELLDNDGISVTSVDPEESLINDEDVELLASHIRKLPAGQRQILEYKFIEEYSNIEIADILHISQTAVSTRVFKAKKRLTEILDNEAVTGNAY
jgi:RNA polymerase sigma-70 factor (ECF subfamily)